MKFKLAFVKQDVYADLYYGKEGNKEFFLQSLQRSGPLALFTEFDSEFYIVSSDETEGFWREKVTCCGHKTFEQWEDVRNEQLLLSDGSKLSQSEMSVPLSDIDFDRFDVVIAVDACIPKGVLQKYNRPLWAYYISEPCMNAYKQSKLSVISGYDVFLNQMFRPEGHPEYLLSESSHEIDFPYAFAYPWIYHQMFGFKKKVDEKASEGELVVVVPSYVRGQLSIAQLESLKERFKVVTPSGSLRNFLGMLCQGDVYLRLGDQAKFGNETIEAVCAGNLFLSTSRGWKNRVFNIDGSVIPGVGLDQSQFDWALARLEELDGDREQLETLAERQREIAKSLCFERPLNYLLKKIKSKIYV